MNRFASLVILILLLVLPCQAAPLVKLVRIIDGATVVIDQGGMQTAVTLAGVTVAPGSEADARAALQPFVGSWVLVERLADGSATIYRSPDGASLNESQQQHGFGNASLGSATHPMTILGIADPGPKAQTRSTRATANAASKPPAAARWKPPMIPRPHGVRHHPHR